MPILQSNSTSLSSVRLNMKSSKPQNNANPIDSYVESLGGKRSIRKVLIANNGIAAVKAIRSIRRWSYETFGDERAVLFVSMATPEDVAANAEYVRMADICASVPGGSNNRNFANVDLICDIAHRFKCDAVWAGWGHASENPLLPTKLLQFGITFLGPNPKSMHALGDKIASTIIAQSANVPTVAWSGSGLTVNYRATNSVPDEIYKKARVLSADHAKRIADQCGYPLVVKASEGGGGKGIRVVFEESAICAAYRQVAGEVPGSPIFLMKLVQNARHLEVQVVADETGDAIALYGRDCSVQRRHQKIIEEGPVVAAPSHVWKRLEQAAIALAKEVGYVGAGTVEYLYKGDKENGQFYFLELNPRLQVEHPVTEWITGVNLPALQLHIGMGIPLRNVPTIRKFLRLSSDPIPVSNISSSNRDQNLSSDISNSDRSHELKITEGNERSVQNPIPPHGHVIACRVTAENPDEGFQPTSGAIQELTFRNTPNVWGYFSVGASGGVHEFADSQFGHLFAWGEDRESSRRSLVLALKELSIRGDIRTTVEYLIKLLEMKAFRENHIDTSWLDSLIADKVVAEKPPKNLAVIVGAVCRAHMSFIEKSESFTTCLERGQLPPMDSTLVDFPIELIYDDVKYCFKVTRSNVSSFRVRLATSNQVVAKENESILVELRALADGAKLVLIDGRSHVCYAREEPAGLRLSIDGKTCIFPKEYDPTSLPSSVSGKLIRFLVESGDHVNQDQPFVELEVMKMYLTLSAPESGRITIIGTEGTSVEIGDKIASLELDDPTKVRKAEMFRGNLPHFEEPQASGTKPHQKFSYAKEELQLLLRGFDACQNCMEDFINSIDDARVCAGEVQECLSALSGRIPANLSEDIESELQAMCTEAGITGDEIQHPSGERDRSSSGLNSHIRHKTVWEKHVKAITSAITKIISLCHNIPEASELCSVASKYCNGTVLTSTVTSLLDEYLNVEKQFARRNGSAGDALFVLRDENKSDLSVVLEMAASHVRLKEKNNALIDFLELLRQPVPMSVLAEDNAQTAEFKARLHQLSQLYAPNYSDIALRARLLLADLRRPHFDQRKSSLGHVLERMAEVPESKLEEEIQNVLSISEPIMDLLVSFVLSESNSTPSRALRKTAIRVQLLRSYRAYEVRDLLVDADRQNSSTLSLTATWKFRFNKRDDGVPGLTKVPGSQEVPLKPLPRGMISFDSADNLAHSPGGSSDLFEEEPYRHGLLAAFESWECLELGFDSVLAEHATKLASISHRDVNVMTVMLRWDMIAPARSNGSMSTLGLKRTKSSELSENFRDPFAAETVVSQALSAFCRAKSSRQDLAKKAGLRTITFIVAQSPSNESASYPGFYTFRVRDNFAEDLIFRHIDPPMAFQLELSRLSNFSITRFGYPNRSLHVFFAQDKTRSVKEKLPESSPTSGKRPPLAGSISKGMESATDRSKKISSDVKSESFANLSLTAQAKPQSEPRKMSGSSDRDIDARFFVRAVIRQADVFSISTDGALISMPEAERTFVEALDAIEMASCDRRFRRTDFNHLFLNVIPPVHIDIEDVETICRRMFQRYANRCWSLRVFAVEIKVPTLVSDEDGSRSVIPLRFLLFNPTGHVLRVESYVESIDPNTGVEKLISVSQDNPGSLHGTQVSEPYRVMDRIQRRRVMAQAMETTYVYDFLHIFARQLQLVWRRYSEDRLLGGFHRHKIPLDMMEATELVLNSSSFDASSLLLPTKRDPGLNDIGMVAWHCIFKTPEYPNGREVILVANDITFRSGSFGPEEDSLFCAASRMSREKGIPRIYLAANSGARIGLAEEIREKLQVNWIDPNSPTKGFSGLAINESDLESVSRFVRTGEKINDTAVKITDIIGAEHGIGVENLMGSGLIAGETSKAYDETFTLTYVSARSVGIGAYLVRLGQRVIQKETAAPIILTGFSALNKVLGHEVYISNEQLGGTKVMHPNGISHSIVRDDVEGVGAILKWLSYVPKARGEPLPIVESRDPVSRPILVRPPNVGQPYDPRKMLLAGEYNNTSTGKQFLSGLFDKDSWNEYLEGWAKTVVVGRARLGGVPTGVVTVETRSVERITPADPASPETRESLVTQAGQVWYPDSAAKTAQAIKDFDREGLPLFILANWRGFSGGMRDMFDEILKSGSLIVDALREYHQPIFVYIPPGGELRGGAWVVLDTLINPEMIEMYADRSARGGVLEPEGTVDVKYRRRNLIKTMHRLDPKLCELDRELTGGKQSGVLLSDGRKQSLCEAIYAREAEILPVYRNVATAFCDLHDTPGRLLEKGAIRSIVDWEQARSFFYWRLQRRLAELRVRKKCETADPSLSLEKITSLLRKWAADYRAEAGVNAHADSNLPVDSCDDINGSFDKDDRWVFHWLEVEEDVIEKRIDRIRAARIATRISESCADSKEGFLDGIEATLRGCKSSEERTALINAIQQKLGLLSSTTSPTLSSSFSILGRLGKFGWDKDRV